MTKIRIYELAKELGIDNKVVLTKAAELGIGGKTSHSNSLEEGEADQIRRAIIREAIGQSPESKVITKVVDTSTGETRTMVERRKGNIIRRRKKSDKERAEELAAEQQREAEETVELEASFADEAFGADSAASSSEPVEKLADSDIFKSKEEIAAEKSGEAVDMAGSGDAFEEPSEGAAPNTEGKFSLFRRRRDVEEDNDGTETSAVVPEASAEADSAQAGGAEVVPTEEEPGTESRKAGPRVLGKIELPQKRKKPSPKKTQAVVVPEVVPDFDEEEEDDDGRPGKKGRKKKGRKREFTRTELVDYDGRGLKRASKGKGAKQKEIQELEEDIPQATELTTPKASKRVVKMEQAITVGEFARQMSLKASEVIGKLIDMGVMATINQPLDQDTATIIADEFGFQVEFTGFDESEVLGDQQEDAPESLISRAPVVTVMGHVDHGKTSLLDAIRESSVVSKEHGGITQHIGAYSVELPDHRTVTFLDTPGHAAFTSMRARGADVTDIVILVVAADDGVMPQTIEAINHAKAAGVPIVVAVNKMDKQGANPDRVRQQLSEYGLQPEDWGGDTMYYPVSALKNDGIGELLEGVLLVAELKELRANPNRSAAGTIVEARQEKGRGTVATVLIQKGTLKVGDIFVCGAEFGRVRLMRNHLGEKLEIAGPSTPVEIAGLSDVPLAGDDFVVVESEAKAKQVANHRREIRRTREQVTLGGGPISLEEFARRTKEQEAAELNVIVKADVQGSLEAVTEAVQKLSREKVRVKPLHGGVGGVNESDVQLALASNAVILAFNVRAEPRALAEAEANGVDVRFYRVIYELTDDVKMAMAGLLAPIKKEVHLGRAEVRDTFSVPKIGTVAGCYILDGLIKRGSQLRLLRDSVVVHEGRMLNLRRFKDDVKEVQSGYECGISFDGFNDIKSGDVIEAFEIKEEAATLD